MFRVMESREAATAFLIRGLPGNSSVRAPSGTDAFPNKVGSCVCTEKGGGREAEGGRSANKCKGSITRRLHSTATSLGQSQSHPQEKNNTIP